VRSRRFLIAGLFSALIFAAGCQPLPQPFQPSDAKKISNPLLDIPDRSGVVVRPVAGMPGESGAALARTMAAALIERNLPAFTENGNRSSLILTGNAIARPRGAARSEIRVIWRVSDPDGLQSGEHVIDIAARKSAWMKGSPNLLREIASKSAGKIAGIIQGPAVTDRTAGKRKRTLHVWRIDGAPETAGALLRAELETSLRRRALRVSSRMRDDSIVIVGVVSLSPGPKGRRQLGIEWSVMSPDGRELGKLNQKNAVTPESLENDWPKIARNIATGAAEGIGDVLSKVPESALSGAPTPKK
jgi:hypothetical protein